MTRQAVILMAAVFLFAPSQATAAYDWTVPASRAPRPEDAARQRVAMAYARADRDAALADLRAFLKASPDDGFGLVEFSSWINVTDPDSARLDAGLRPDGAGSWGIELSPAARAFVRGAVLRLQSRGRSALRWFDRALALHPGWSWARLYRARVLSEMAVPDTAWRADMDAAFADPDVMPYAVYVFVRPSDGRILEGRLDRERRSLAFLKTVPWLAEQARGEEAVLFFEAGGFTEAAFDSVWRSLETPDGTLRNREANQAAYAVRITLPYLAAMKVLERRERDTRSPTPWREARAYLLDDAQDVVAAESLLVTCDHLSASGEALLLNLRSTYRPAAELVPAAMHLARRSVLRRVVNSATAALRLCGRDTEATRLLRIADEEDPEAALMDRAAVMFAAQPQRLPALVDSLMSAGVDPGHYYFAVLFASEVNGVPVGDDELDRLVPWLQSYVERELEAFAEQHGDRARAAHLAARRNRDAGRSLGLVMSRALDAARAGSADAVSWCDRLDRMAPGSVAALSTRLFTLSLLGDGAAADTVLQRAIRAPRRDPAWRLTLARGAVTAKHLDEARRLLADVQPSGRRDVRQLMGYIEAGSGNREAARQVLQALVDEFPGDEAAREALASAVGTTESQTAGGADDEASPFEGLDGDFESTDWILQRAAVADTMAADPYVVLLRHFVYLCDRLDRYAVRSRVVIHVSTRAAVDALGHYSVPFLAENGAPTVRVARVIDRDGTVTEVPRSSILITANRSSESDVSNSRTLVVPFPNLKVGAVIDLVIEQQATPYLWQRHGWSLRHSFAAYRPTLENVVELRTREPSPARVYLGNGAPEPEIRHDGAYTWRRWAIKDQAALPLVEGAPGAMWRAPWIGVTTHSDWNAAIAAYQALFWRNAAADDALRKEAVKLTAGAKDPAARLERLLAHVAEHVNYLAIELNQGRVVPAAASDVETRGYGDCKDMAALLIAMLDAVGVRAQPALVRLDDDWPTIRAFVDPSGFDHMIVYVPDVGGGIYVDPTVRPRCAAELSAYVQGKDVLTFDREGQAVLRHVHDLRPSDHGFHMTIDVHPESDQRARIEVEQRFRGQLANEIRQSFANATESEREQLAERSAGYWRWDSTHLEHWNLEDDGCNRITLRATYADTAWAGAHSSLLIPLDNEVADPFFSYPDTTNRHTPVLLDYPFADTVVLRLHATTVWRPSADVWPMHVSGPFFEGSITGREVDSGGDRRVEITQWFTIRRNRFSAAELKDLFEQWSRFRIGVVQRYTYRRILSDSDRKRLLGYARAHPDDAGFVLQAMGTLLGDDLGGTGAEGRERRRVARALLTPLAYTSSKNAASLAYLALIESKDGHQYRCDSLLTEALKLTPDDVSLLDLAGASRKRIEDQEGAIEVLRRASRLGGDALAEFNLLVRLQVAGHHDEMAAEEQRLRALYPDAQVESVLHLAKLSAAVERHDCDEARRLMQDVPDAIKPTAELLSMGIASECGDYARAVDWFEKRWLENPNDQDICNELAWIEAQLGRHLDRAEELAENAVRMSDRQVEMVNTLGFVRLRRGDVAGARELFTECIRRDDSPVTQRVNRYMLGLCDAAEGHREQAIEQWKTVAADRFGEPWSGHARRSIDLVEHGEDPMRALTERGGS